jgi:hypothetical protein
VVWVAGRPRAGTGRVVSSEAGVVVVQIALAPPPAPDPPLLGAALVRRWIVACTAGELVGFTVPAVAGALTAATTPPAPAVMALLVAAGSFEGAILGLAQAVALRRALPGVPTVAWIRATALGAGVAWAAGMVPSTLGDRLDDVPVAAVVAVAVPLGLMMLLGIGVLQARCLCGHVARPWRWVAASAAAWTAGLCAGTLVWTRWAEGQPLALVIAIGLAGAAVMALVMAAISGAALARLAREPQRSVESA